MVLGRSELSLEPYLQALEGKDAVRVVCMDLSVTYRAVVRKHFPKALLVADRLAVSRLINHHFLACWREIDPGSKNRGLLSLMRGTGIISLPNSGPNWRPTSQSSGAGSDLPVQTESFAICCSRSTKPESVPGTVAALPAGGPRSS